MAANCPLVPSVWGVLRRARTRVLRVIRPPGCSLATHGRSQPSPSPRHAHIRTTFMLQRKSSPTCQRICSTHCTQERAMSVQMHAYRPPHHLCRPEQRKGITCAHITDMHTARRAHSTSTRIQPPAHWPRAQNALHRSRARTHMQEQRPRHGRRHSDGHSHEHGPPSASSGIKVGGPGH